MYEGETTVVRAGGTALRDVTYRLTYRNGKLVARKVRAPAGRSQAGRRDRQGRHQASRPRPPTSPAAARVWDPLAQCESGGNWAINTGNGYYGGLQFILGTWQAYGGTGLPEPGQPRDPDRDRRPSSATPRGGYGAWPGCAASSACPADPTLTALPVTR